jgi:hypothetical protein
MMHQSDTLSDHAGPGLGRTLLMTLTLGLLVVASWRRIGATHARRTGSKPKKLPRRLQTWEGEGGRPSDSDDHAPELHPEPLPHVAGSQTLRQH